LNLGLKAKNISLIKNTRAVYMWVSKQPPDIYSKHSLWSNQGNNARVLNQR